MNSKDETTNFMKSLDEDYRQETRLNDREQYKLFYSRIEKCPILILGLNPGGDPESKNLNASDSYFENFEHDYVDFRNNPRYTIARPMYDLLTEALGGASESTIRRIPKTNLIFRRSSRLSKLPMSSRQAASEARPYVERIIRRVMPEIIIIEGSSGFQLFQPLCRELRETDQAKVYTPNGKSDACLYRVDVGFVTCLKREIVVVTLGHPSKFSGRLEWSSDVVPNLKTQIEGLKAQIEGSYKEHN